MHALEFKFRDFENHGIRTNGLDWDAVMRDYTANQERERAEAIGLNDDMVYNDEESAFFQKLDEKITKHSPSFSFIS